MLPGLNALELGRLRLSVGYGTHKKGRPLSPAEVGQLLRQARRAGVTLKDCAKAIQLNGTGHIGRFLRILELPQDILHLVDWGHPGDGIAFSCAVEMKSLESDDDKRAVARSILAHGLESKEVRQVAQLRTRSGRSIGECIDEVLGMRPTVEKRYVFIGSVTEESLANALGKLTQRERDAILVSGIERLELSGGSGRLGQRFFTLVGDERFDASMERIGKDNIETLLLAQIGEAIDDAAPLLTCSQAERFASVRKSCATVTPKGTLSGSRRMYTKTTCRNSTGAKGEQDFLLSPETHELLIAERNAELEYRDNFIRVPRGTEQELDDGSKLSLIASNHMLGACQVALELPDGMRIGYSSDFGWPLDKVIEVDELVVDSTYGSPRSVRGYTQDEAEASLFDLVHERLRHGSVHIRAHPGTIERVLLVLGDNVGVPVVASGQLIQKVEVYQKHGFAPGSLKELRSDDGRHAMAHGSYVRLYSKGDGFGNECLEGTTITCSAYMVDTRSPLMTYSERAYSVALSNHADFEETLAYVEATGAKQVVTDNTRNHGCELAIAINQRLDDVQAIPSGNDPASSRNM